MTLRIYEVDVPYTTPPTLTDTAVTEHFRWPVSGRLGRLSVRAGPEMSARTPGRKQLVCPAQLP
jgi:hypothetical protein